MIKKSVETISVIIELHTNERVSGIFKTLKLIEVAQSWPTTTLE